MKLAVGDAVVYPAYGVGRVLAREQRMVQGAMQEVLVLGLPDGLSVTLPMERARGLLRPLLSETDLGRVQEMLREDHAPSDDRWLKRRKDTQLKLSGGDPLGLVEVVRDGALRQRRLIAKQNDLVPVFWSWLMRIRPEERGSWDVEVVCAGVPSAGC